MGYRVVTLYKIVFETENDWKEICRAFGEDPKSDKIHVYVSI